MRGYRTIAASPVVASIDAIAGRPTICTIDFTKNSRTY